MVGLTASVGSVSGDAPVAPTTIAVDADVASVRLDEGRASRNGERSDLVAESERSAAQAAAAAAWSQWWVTEKAARDAAAVEAAAAQAEAAAEAEAQAAAEAAAQAAAEAAEQAAAAADPGTPDANRALGRSMLFERGYGEADFDCLDRIWTQESQWMTTAENPSSGAYGIPQSLPASKMATAGDDWRTNPATQITWGLDYIEERYGSMCSAWNFKAANGWY